MASLPDYESIITRGIPIVTNMNIFDFFLKASFLVQIIILILIGFSVASWAIIIQGIKTLSTATREMKIFKDHFWSNVNDLSYLYKKYQDQLDTLTGTEQIFYAGFKEFSCLCQANLYTPETIMNGTSRAMRISINREIESLETHIPFLGILGSISPYLGLFGTIWGIMHAFIALGSVKQATLTIVAPGIAEALIATEIGLFTAIPAVMAYNQLNQHVNKLEQSHDNFMEEFLAILYLKAFSYKNNNCREQKNDTI